MLSTDGRKNVISDIVVVESVPLSDDDELLPSSVGALSLNCSGASPSDWRSHKGGDAMLHTASSNPCYSGATSSGSGSGGGRAGDTVVSENCSMQVPRVVDGEVGSGGGASMNSDHSESGDGG